MKIVEAKNFNRTTTNPRRRDAVSKIYVFTKGESVLENLQNRRERPHTVYRKMILEQYPELKGRIGWRQNAGCGCGCSPGFVVDTALRDANNRVYDMFLTVGEEE